MPQRFNADGFYDSTRGQVAPCHGNYDSARIAFFCGESNGTGFVAWDMQFFREKAHFSNHAYYVVVAHEIGHAAQSRFVADRQYAATYGTKPLHELEADCLSGAALSKAVQDGYLSQDDGDLDKAKDLMLATHDSESHGTPEQRVKWFFMGYDSNYIETCLGQNGVAPPTP